MTTSLPPAGWYPDPFAERWWDGESWAPIARDEGVAVAPITVEAGSTAEGWYADPFAERWWDGVAWTETARSSWDPHELVAPEMPADHDGTVVGDDSARDDRRRMMLLAGGAVVVAGLVGSAVALAFNDGGQRLAGVDSAPSSAALPSVVTTAPVTVAPITDAPATAEATTSAATTVATVPGAPNITINAATTSVWNTALPPVSGVPPTMPGTPTTTPPATTPPGSAEPSTVPPPTTGAPAESTGRSVVPRSASATCEAPTSYANDGTAVSFGAGNVIDGDETTAWRCQIPVEDDSLTLTFAERTRLRSVGLIGGYTKVDPTTGVDRFEENYRVKEVRWRFDGGATVVQRLEDSRQMQTMSVDVNTTTVEIEIVDVYPPSFPEGHSRYRPYVAISEVAFNGRS